MTEPRRAEPSPGARELLAHHDRLDLAEMVVALHRLEAEKRAALARVRKACDSVRAADQGHNPAVDWVVMRVLEAIDARLVSGGLPPVPPGPAVVSKPRDCLFAHGGGRPCKTTDRCATCDSKEA